MVAVGILAAAYFFIVRPALDTTEKISHEVNVNVQKGFEQTNLGDIGKTIDDVNRRVQREIRRSFHQSQQHGHAHKLVHCIQRAHQDVDRIQRCTAKY
ncbi:MAG: hypothetical protein ACTHN7_11815 [Solirubrobacterales bacterium]